MNALVKSDTALEILQRLADHKFDLATGVPCSLLTGLFSLLEDQDGLPFAFRYVRAPREDSAVGLAVGAQLAGSRPVVLMQNSGLGYSLNVLTSLTMIYDINPLLIISWRGHHAGDAVEHDIIGRELLNVLGVFGIDSYVIGEGAVQHTVDAAVQNWNSGRNPVALLVTEAI